MKLFKPQLQLARESEEQSDGSFRDHYYLHVVTFTDRTNYRADDCVVDDTALASEGKIKIKAYMYQDLDIPDFNYLTPVVHTLDLGMPVEVGTEFIVEVTARLGMTERNGGSGSGGSTQTGSSGADEDGRPGGN